MGMFVVCLKHVDRIWVIILVLMKIILMVIPLMVTPLMVIPLMVTMLMIIPRDWVYGGPGLGAAAWDRSGVGLGSAWA